MNKDFNKLVRESLKDNEHKKNILRGAGFDKEVKRVEFNLCPFCGQPVRIEDFKDALSRREYEISGMCQTCQDAFFE